MCAEAAVAQFDWSRTTTSELIELFRSSPCLWNVRHKDYKNRTLKHTSMCLILDCMKSHNASITIDEIKKWANLRTQYHRERKKVQQSTKSGAGTLDIHVPRLWFYSQIGFLDDAENQRSSVSNFDGLQQPVSKNCYSRST